MEIALGSQAFPTVKLPVDSFVYQFLKKEDLEIAKDYELEPFEMTVQSIERTFTDKVFAICDYYLEGNLNDIPVSVRFFNNNEISCKYHYKCYNNPVKGGDFMAQAVNVNFRMDSGMKNDMEKICSELGLTMTAAFTIFAKKMIRERRIPFDVALDPFYSEENMKRLRHSVEQMESTGGTIHEVSYD